MITTTTLDHTLTVGQLLPDFAIGRVLTHALKARGASYEAADFGGRVCALAKDTIRDALDIKVLDVLVAGWRKSIEVSRAIKDTRDSPIAVGIDLYEHTIKATEYPELEITIAGQKLPPVRFELELSIQINAAHLNIRAGRVLSMATGEMSVGMRLTFEGIHLIPPWTSPPMRLPGHLPIGAQTDNHDKASQAAL
jgi:hypothetical protein